MHAYYILYNFMYKMALRISEICNYSPNCAHAILYEYCMLHEQSNTIIVKLLSHKHSSSTTTYRVKCNDKLIYHLKAYFNMRGSSPGPLLCHPNGSPFTRAQVLKQLKFDLQCSGFNSELFNTHSFRAGKATDLAELGCSNSQIALIGRWHSEAYKSYIRPASITV